MAERGVIFDMDGVLVDSYGPHFESWRRMAAEHGLEMTEPEFATTFGRTSRDIIRHFWGSRLDDEQIRRMDDRKEELYRQIIADDFPAMDGARELLIALDDAGFALAIGSSGPQANVELCIDKLDVRGRITATVTGGEVRRGKPDPQVFLLAAEKLGLSPRSCAVVEDAPAGAKAARAAGAAAIAITGTADRAQLAPLADVVIDSLRELSPARIAELIDRHNQG